MHRSVVALAFTLAAACGGSTLVAPKPPPPAEKPHGFVRLRPTATLFVARDEAAEHAQYFPSESEAAKYGGEAYPVFRLAAFDGEWAEVETIWGDARQCGDGMVRLSDFDLRVFVHASDLQPITVREARVVYPDDTSLTVTAGLPVIENAQGHRAIVVDGEVHPAPIPDDAVGLGYEPSPHFSHDGAIGMLDESKAPGVRFAGVTHPTMQLPRMPAMPGEPLEPLDVFARKPLGDGRELVTLRTECAQYDVVVASAAVTEGETFGMGGLGLMGTGTGGLHTKEHASVFSRQGQSLGVTRNVVGLFGLPESAPAQGRRCFLFGLAPGRDEGLNLCFSSDDLEK